MNTAARDDEAGTRSEKTTVIRGPEAMHEALCKLVAAAQSHIQVCAPMFEPKLFNTGQVTDALVRFITRHRQNRLDLMVEDSRQVLRENARLIGLLQKLSDFAELRELGEEDRGQHDLFVCVDRRHYLHQLDVSHPECVLADGDRQNALLLTHRFNAGWARAAPVAVSRTLGL
jgi:hypothetical protein